MILHIPFRLRIRAAEASLVPLAPPKLEVFAAASTDSRRCSWPGERGRIEATSTVIPLTYTNM